MAVRPHPHIHLSTVTYLFEGEIEHRDSLGVHQVIRPGAINWMTAGRGIVHSERSSREQRARASRLDGIQLWLALPQELEDIDPSFVHHPASSIPETPLDGATLRVLAGKAYGCTSPVETLHPLCYVDATLPANSRIPVPDQFEERAIYVAHGEVTVGGQPLVERQMAVLTAGHDLDMTATAPSRVMILGGAPLDGPRHLWWNFVSSSEERIERAKSDWKEGRFPKIPGDNSEFIPLPD